MSAERSVAERLRALIGTGAVIPPAAEVAREIGCTRQAAALAIAAEMRRRPWLTRQRARTGRPPDALRTEPRNCAECGADLGLHVPGTGWLYCAPCEAAPTRRGKQRLGYTRKALPRLIAERAAKGLGPPSPGEAARALGVKRDTVLVWASRLEIDLALGTPGRPRGSGKKTTGDR